MLAEPTSTVTTFKPCHRHRKGVLQILSVDDDIINQVVAEQLLKSQKWLVVKAMNGQQALDVINTKSELPDLILLDIMMPGMSGFEVLSKLRETYPPSVLPIVMVSAKTEEDDVIEALRRGADDYVTKPYKRAEMAARIEAHLRARDSALQYTNASQPTASQPMQVKHALLPAIISQRLQAGEPNVVDHCNRGTVLAARIVDAEARLQSISGCDGVSFLNALHSTFDELCSSIELTGSATLGTYYIVTDCHPNLAEGVHRMVLLAQRMLDAVAKLQWPDGSQLQVSIALLSGSVTRATVGTKVLSYALVSPSMEDVVSLVNLTFSSCICLNEVAHDSIRENIRCSSWCNWNRIDGSCSSVYIVESHNYQIALQCSATFLNESPKSRDQNPQYPAPESFARIGEQVAASSGWNNGRAATSPSESNQRHTSVEDKEAGARHSQTFYSSSSSIMEHEPGFEDEHAELRPVSSKLVQQIFNDYEQETRTLQNKVVELQTSNARLLAERDFWLHMTNQLKAVSEAERNRLDLLVRELARNNVQEQLGELWKEAQTIKQEMGAVAPKPAAATRASSSLFSLFKRSSSERKKGKTATTAPPTSQLPSNLKQTSSMPSQPASAEREADLHYGVTNTDVYPNNRHSEQGFLSEQGGCHNVNSHGFWAMNSMQTATGSWAAGISPSRNAVVPTNRLSRSLDMPLPTSQGFQA